LRSRTATGITVKLSDELAALLAEEAARQSLTPEELASRTLAEYIAKRRFGSVPGEPTPPAADAGRPETGTPGEPGPWPGWTAVRVMADVPAAVWLGLFLLVYAAIVILIIVVIVKAIT
jgi:predicted transcriptional regulator